MANPLASIAPVLEILGNNISILPATGTAVEDLQHPYQDEIDDILLHRDMGQEVTAFAEEPEPSTTDIYRPTPPIPRTEHHLFRFFMDGSLRTYFLATGMEGTRSFPIELAQLGASVVMRDDSGRLSILCALLNTSPAKFAVQSYATRGGKSFGTPHVLEHICVPKFGPEDKVHSELACLSKQAHQAAADGDEETIASIEKRIDKLAAAMWGLTEAELNEIKYSQAELQS